METAKSEYYMHNLTPEPTNPVVPEIFLFLEESHLSASISLLVVPPVQILFHTLFKISF